MYNCQYCQKECKNKNSLTNHQRLCKQNPSRDTPVWLGKKRPDRTGVPSWSKGLTKANDPRILAHSEAVKARYKNNELTPHQRGVSRTAEEKAKISITMKANPNAGGLRKGSGRGKKGWYKGFFCDSTYELVYVIYNLDHNIKFTRCSRTYFYNLDGTAHKYYPDFELEDGSIVEIKGYHTATVDLKLSSVTDRPIQVFYEKDLKYAFDWVKEHYEYKDLSDLYE